MPARLDRSIVATAWRLAVLAACLVLPPGDARAAPPVPAWLPSWRRSAEERTELPARQVGSYAQRYGLYNYRRNWYAMPYRYRSYYYRPWYTLPPSNFVVPKNYSPYVPPTWSLPWPYGEYPSQQPLLLDGWDAAPPPEMFEPAGPPAEIFEPIAPPRAGGRYYW